MLATFCLTRVFLSKSWIPSCLGFTLLGKKCFGNTNIDAGSAWFYRSLNSPQTHTHTQSSTYLSQSCCSSLPWAPVTDLWSPPSPAISHSFFSLSFSPLFLRRATCLCIIFISRGHINSPPCKWVKLSEVIITWNPRSHTQTHKHPRWLHIALPTWINN